MGWIQLILGLLNLANYIMNVVRENQLLDAGEERAIAKASASILAKTTVAKEELAIAMGLTEEEVDQGLKDQEPK